MICATDPVLATVGLTAQDIERITSMPWHVNAQQVVDGKQCLVLEIDGHRVRLLTRGDEVTMDGARRAVQFVMFWIRS